MFGDAIAFIRNTEKKNQMHMHLKESEIQNLNVWMEYKNVEKYCNE